MKACPVCQKEYPVEATRCADDGVPLVALGAEVRGRSEDLLGEVVEGRWKIERIIGKGGMGTVYSCRHLVVGKVAAIKVLRAGSDNSDAVLQRFVREAQTANVLRNRHIVEVSDFGQLPSGAFFVVMELLEGQDLARAMRAGMGRRELVHVFTQVAETLQLAHEKGIVHRDLKPDNVYLVNEAGDPLFVKLLDFGIAKIMHGDRDGGLTETGVILGTPYYMSPEQARAEGVDHRTDIYALGVIMYRAFTGRLPFMADSTMGVLTRHITEAPQPPSEIGNVDVVTERMILRCLAKKPEYRFQSMRELADALRLVPLDVAVPAQGGGHPYAPSQAHAPVLAPSGAYAAATPGSMPSMGIHYQATGAQTPAALAASHTPQPTSHPNASGAYAASAYASGAYASSAYASSAYASSAYGASPQAYAHGPGGAPVMQGMAPMPEPTTSGVAAPATAPTPARGANNGLLLAVGGLSTAAIGAVVALVVFGRSPAPQPTPAAPPAPTVVAAPPSATATTATTATTTPTTSASASVPAPTATASVAATAGPAASASARPTGRFPKAAPPPPTSTTPPPGPKLPNGVRSPFD